MPRNTARLDVTYAPPALQALKIGASVQYQSRISTVANAPSGLTQSDYALVDLLARYDLTERGSLSANLKNLTDTKYLTAFNFDQGYYGAPRTVLGTVTFRY